MTNMSMVDTDQMLVLIDQLRASIPRTIHEAQELIERREQIVNQTMIDARRIRSTAEGDARLLVDETELVKAAHQRSEEIVQDANSKADRIISLAEQEAQRRRDGADDYSRDCLHTLEEHVSNMLNEIHAGQRALLPAVSLSAKRPALDRNRAPFPRRQPGGEGAARLCAHSASPSAPAILSSVLFRTEAQRSCPPRNPWPLTSPTRTRRSFPRGRCMRRSARSSTSWESRSQLPPTPAAMR